MSSPSPLLPSSSRTSYEDWTRALVRASHTSSISATPGLERGESLAGSPADRAANADAIAELWHEEPDFEMVLAAGMLAHTSPRNRRASLGVDDVPLGFDRLGLGPEAPSSGDALRAPVPSTPTLLLTPPPQATDLPAPSAPEPRRAAYHLRAHTSLPPPRYPERPKRTSILSRSDIDAAAQSDSLLVSVAEAARRRRSTEPHKNVDSEGGAAAGPVTSRLSAASSLSMNDDPATYVIVEALLTPSGESSASQSPGLGPHFAGSSFPFFDALAQPADPASPSTRPSSGVSLMPNSPHSQGLSPGGPYSGYEAIPSALSRSWQPPGDAHETHRAYSGAFGSHSTVAFGPPPRRTRRPLAVVSEHAAPKAYDDAQARQTAFRLAESYAERAASTLAQTDEMPPPDSELSATVLSHHSIAWTLLLVSEPTQSRTQTLAEKMQSMEGVLDRLRQLSGRSHGAVQRGEGRRALLQLKNLGTQTQLMWVNLLQSLDRPNQRSLRQAILHKGVSLTCLELEVLAQLPCELVRDPSDAYLPNRRQVLGTSLMSAVAPMQVRLFHEEFALPRLKVADALPPARLARAEHDINRAMWFEVTRYWRALANFGHHLLDNVSLFTQLIEEAQNPCLAANLQRQIDGYEDLALESEQGLAHNFVAANAAF